MTPLPSNATDRSAHASIKGYCYQFDRTILEILAASDDIEVFVEGLEDIDLLGPDRAAAVQVKYWSSRKYATPRSLNEPIEPMLEACAQGANHNFILHVYFGEGGNPPSELTTDQLRECLTRTTRKPKAVHLDYEKYSDSVIADFVSKLEIRVGREYSEQRDEVFRMLARHLSASEEDARDLYYANALKLIQELAMSADENQRKTNRQELLSRINTRATLYERWHAEFVGIERYTKRLARRLKAQGLLDARRAKGVIVSASGDSDGVLLLARCLATQEYGPGKLYTTKPWTIVLDGSIDEVHQLKRGLLERNIAIQDGHEGIEFHPAIFDALPIINRRNRCDTIKEASYLVRVISLASFRRYVEEGFKLDILIAVRDEEDELYSRGSTEPPVYVRGLKAEDVQRLVGGRR